MDPTAPPLGVQGQLSQALSELQQFRASADRFQAENQELRAEADALRAELRAASGDAPPGPGLHVPPPSVRAMLDEALAELKAKAAENSELHAQAAENSELREKAAQADKLRAELLLLRKQTEQVRHEDTLFHSIITVTSKTKMEKTGTSLIHTKPNQLRRLFLEAPDQALPPPPSAWAPPPNAIVHTLSEKDTAVLFYRNLAVRNIGGLANMELFEFHLHVAESTENPNLITLRTLSDDEAEHLCGDLYARQVETKREKVDLKKLKRVQVTAAIARGATKSCSLEVAEAVLSFLAGATRSLHDRFGRYKEVDEATLRHFVEHGMSSAPESSEKEKALILRRLQDDDQKESSWSRLAGTVREPVSYFKKVDEDSNTWGKAEGVVDVSAPDVLAWLWYSCTHERSLKYERKNGNLLKTELDVPGTRSKFIVVSMKMPRAISNRVFANWWTWAKEQNGDLIAAFTPHEDYGSGAEKETVDAALEAEKRSVIGKLRGFYRIKTLASNVCRVTLVAQGDAGGTIGKQAMAWGIKFLLGIVKNLKDKCMRNGAKVDAEMRGAFPAPPLRRSLTREQDAMVARCLSLEKDAEASTRGSRKRSNVMAAVSAKSAAAQARAVKGSWVELRSTSLFVSMSMKYTKGSEGGSDSSVAIGKAKATLDCSATEAFAHQFAVCGREKMILSKEGGDRARFIFKEHTTHDFEWALVKKMPFPLTNREFLGRYLSFKEPTGDLVVVFEALPDSTKVDYGANLKVVRGKGTGVLRLKSINDGTQCEVTLVQHGDAGGFVPEGVMVAKIPQALRPVADMRELFQRDDAIDGAKRSELAAIINTNKQPYLPDETALVKKIGAKFASLPAFEKLDSPDHFVHMSWVFKEGSSAAIGRATTIVDAPIAEVAAWELAKMSRENQKEHVAFGGLDRNLKKINDHQDIYHVVYELSIPGFLPRQWVTRVVWKWAAGKKELTVIADSVDHTDFPERKEYLRASSTVMVKYKQEAEVGEVPQTKVTWTQQVDLGGVIPKWAQNRQGVGQLMYLSLMRKRFDRSLELDGKKREELVKMIRRHGRDGVEYSEEEEKMVAEGKTPEEVLAHVWDTKARHKTRPDDLEKEIDEKPNAHNQLVFNKKQTPAVISNRDFLSRAWRNQNPSMKELFEKYPWVEEMVLTMGEELLKNAAWGLWFRVITGSGLSMLDLATDINVILVYFGETGQEWYGWMMLGMVLASMGLQLVGVLIQNGKMGWGKLLSEMLIVLLGLKPGVDAMRVVSNAEMHEHHVLDATMELACTKGIEMFCESIPGCILQVMALTQGGSEGATRTKVVSIFISAITTGMGSASISYDFDSDPEKREKLPNFYGYLPDEGNARTIMYVCMVINSALLLLLRSIGAALLMLADTKIFIAYMAGDHLLYLLLKLVLAFAIFLSLMKKKYRSTFWSMETGNEWIQAFFIQGGSDDIKKNVLKYNSAKWKAIEPQVKEWIRDGWVGWERDKPDWYTDNWKAKVPGDWVPKEGKAGHERAKESVRRRSIGGGGRERSVVYAAD
ncbi:hypothetical protein TeGR_g10416 [Tetraparma gracilis]|uniref:START domain-containing protein n=1 Tax=Tetraparma gracilis TaxID=2962635 RepID=A0ABQ6ML37_9STRA|nr:hypothetical protein TeGR_g10416 [Tetraparma gracilis]